MFFSILLLKSNMSCAQTGDTYLTLINANIANVLTGKIDRGRTVIIRNDRIESIFLNKSKGVKGKVIDVANGFLVSGLIDAHAHVTNITYSRIEAAYKILNFYLKHGITTIRDPAGNGRILKNVQDTVDNDLRVGSMFFTPHLWPVPGTMTGECTFAQICTSHGNSVLNPVLIWIVL